MGEKEEHKISSLSLVCFCSYDFHGAWDTTVNFQTPWRDPLVRGMSRGMVVGQQGLPTRGAHCPPFLAAIGRDHGHCYCPGPLH